jgi:DmsE family decaheme c-type cytochrome
MKFMRQALTLLALVGTLGLSASLANAADSPGGKTVAKDIVLKGDAKCTGCHDESEQPKPSMLDLHPQVLKIGKTKHGTIADGRTPTCTDCHGESEKHISYKGSAKPPAADYVYTKGTKTDPSDRNTRCLTCHQTDARRMFWGGSQHQARDVACTSCHQIHTEHDSVRDKRTQPEICFNCHKDQRALANKPSHHPIPEGKMTCSDCHNVHGSPGNKLLAKDTTNATCYQCHAEKRGPYLWAHQPVTDDCANCHNPHGTTADFMLKTRAPFLCLSCHDPSSHPGNVPGVASRVDMSRNASGAVLSATAPADNLNSSGVIGKTQGLSCNNCHTDIHGSNNPMNSTRSKRFWR